ncbi:hypothetical protein [Gluconobacter sp.]
MNAEHLLAQMTEHQDFDLAAVRYGLMAFWQKSENDLETFRHLLTEKNWCMRPGERTEQRREAHVIETDNGVWIGSFTRLTKVRMKDFQGRKTGSHFETFMPFFFNRQAY